MEPALNSELRRLRSDVERLSLEAQRKEREVTLLTGVICRLETELVRNSNTTPAEATIGGANLRDLLQLSPPDLLVLDDDIRLMRRKVLDRAPTGYAEDVQEYLTKAMREAMIRRGVRYDDGADSDWKDPWFNVYQKQELEDDARLLGLRDSRRGVPGRVVGGRYDITVACDTLIGLSRWRGRSNTSNSLTVVSMFPAKDKAFPPPTDLFKHAKATERDQVSDKSDE
ncbi:hypothetical protein EV702DRAFT_1040939 [Suillus placidus]|uniref:Uncharacterized protein n=1 Tax=Suillus placidus TaxID=48579 RepID=A0A9P7A6C3_9AGAM|nr:hypothetical protein EV702DRAFT_1040939 [Suillus placidus]